jgi:hypothetical protein
VSSDRPAAAERAWHTPACVARGASEWRRARQHNCTRSLSPMSEWSGDRCADEIRSSGVASSSPDWSLQHDARQGGAEQQTCQCGAVGMARQRRTARGNQCQWQCFNRAEKMVRTLRKPRTSLPRRCARSGLPLPQQQLPCPPLTTASVARP